MDHIEQIAQSLFESDEHAELSQTFNKYGLELSWRTAPTPVKDLYKIRAQKSISQPDISPE